MKTWSVYFFQRSEPIISHCWRILQIIPGSRSRCGRFLNFNQFFLVHRYVSGNNLRKDPSVVFRQTDKQDKRRVKQYQQACNSCHVSLHFSQLWARNFNFFLVFLFLCNNLCVKIRWSAVSTNATVRSSSASSTALNRTQQQQQQHGLRDNEYHGYHNYDTQPLWYLSCVSRLLI